MAQAAADKDDFPIPQTADKLRTSFFNLSISNHSFPLNIYRSACSLPHLLGFSLALVTLSLLLRKSDLFICRSTKSSGLWISSQISHPLSVSLSLQPWQRIKPPQPFPYFNREH